MALGLAGCAVGTEEPVDESTGEQSAELDADYAGQPADNGTGSATLGNPRDVLLTPGSDDPGGPTPYPWQTSDDPSGGPTPYPWDDDADETDSTNDSTQTAGSGTGATQTSTNH
jgi:hypothetical protein